MGMFDDLFGSKGISLNKYTGARGKSGASDANAEFVAYVRRVFENNNVKYQVSELGKVDIGGGGTIAYILANKGIDVIDCGVPVISMHSPYEVTSKYDIYSAYNGYKAFFEATDKLVISSYKLFIRKANRCVGLLFLL